MKFNPRTALSTLALLSIAPFAQADSIEDATNCLVNKTNGEDRKALVTWVYLAMSKHPEISALSAITPDREQTINQNVGKTMTRLLADDCGAPMKAMFAEHGPSSIAQPFEVLGKVAMQELMTDPAVNQVFSNISQHIDQERVEQALGD